MSNNRFLKFKIIIFYCILIIVLNGSFKLLPLHSQGEKRKPLVSFCFDDNCMRQAPILTSKGVKGTICFVINWIKPGDLEKMHVLEDEGWEIASHSVTHSKEPESEYRDSKNYLKERGFNVTGFVYPGGGATAQHEEWARKYYEWARDVVTYKVGYTHYDRLCNHPPINPYHLLGCHSAGHSLKEYQNIVDYVERSGDWVIFYTHGHTDEISDEDLSRLIDYIQAKNIDILPIREALKIYGN